MTDPTPTPLPAAPDWRALCKELLQAIDNDVIYTNDGPRFQAVVDCTRAALAQSKPAKNSAECSNYIEALKAIAQYGSDTLSGRVDGPDDREWQRDAVREMTNRADAALATPPAATREAGPEPDAALAALKLPTNWYQDFADWLEREMPEGTVIGDPLRWASSIADWLIAKATREAGPLPQAGLTDEQLLEVAAAAIDGYDSIAPGEFEPEAGLAVEACGSELIAFARAVLARWGGAAVGYEHGLVDGRAEQGTTPEPEPDDFQTLHRAGHGGDALGTAAAIRALTNLAYEDYNGKKFLYVPEVLAMQPVPVSERPWERPGWCDAESRCWIGEPEPDYPLGETGDFDFLPAEWKLFDPTSLVTSARPIFLLPHWALPVPAADKGEVQP